MKETENGQYARARRKRLQGIKKALIILAIVLIVLSAALNIYLLIRVIHLTGLVNSLYELEGIAASQVRGF